MTNPEEAMPRLRFIEERELDEERRALIASAERTGAPDPRVVRIMVRSSAGLAWVKCWNSVPVSYTHLTLPTILRV